MSVQRGNRSAIAVLLFLMGLFSSIQFYFFGRIAISEFVVFLLAPIVFVMDLNTLRRDGFMPLLVLALMSVIGTVLSGWHNHTPMPLLMRGFATMYALFAIPVVVHRFLRWDLNGLKWLLLGTAISQVARIFVGVGSDEIDLGEGVLSSAELAIMIYFGGLFTLPAFFFYFQSPTWLTIAAYMFPTVYVVINSSSGRSALMVTLVAVFMLGYVHRNVARMRMLKKRLMLLASLGFSLAFCLAAGYKFAAKNGYLNERAQKKYEAQTKGGTKNGPLAMLMAGRGEFFIGLFACLDNPIWGLGAWATDVNNYTEQFLSKYGDQEDAEKVYAAREWAARGGRMPGLPCHSMILQNWVYCGILGAFFWPYVFVLMLRLFRRYIDAVPQWFGYLAILLPNYLWAILFSPIGGRFALGIFLAVILMAIAVGKGKMRLPAHMAIEAWRHNK